MCPDLRLVSCAVVQEGICVYVCALCFCVYYVSFAHLRKKSCFSLNIVLRMLVFRFL